MTYVDKTGTTVKLPGDAGQQNIAANKAGLDYVASGPVNPSPKLSTPWNGVATVDTPADIAAAKTATATGVPVPAAGMATVALAKPAYNGLNPVIPPTPEKILPRAGMVINDQGIEVPIINRSIRSATGTDQNVGGASNISAPTGGVGTLSDNRTQAEKDASVYLDSTFTPPKTEAQIIADRTEQSKGKIQALNEYYASQKENLAPVNEMRTREANAQAVLRGLSGSSEAGTIADVAAKKNEVASNAISADYANKMADVYQGIQDFAHTEAKAQTDLATSSAKDILARSADVRSKALTHLETIAKLPSFNLDSIKLNDPTTYDTLAKSVGGEDVMKGIVSYSRPASTIVGTPAIIGDEFTHTTVKNPDGTTHDEYTRLPQNIIDALKAGKKLELVPTANGTIVSYNGGKSLTSLSNLFKETGAKAQTPAVQQKNDIATAIMDFQKQIKEKGWSGANPDAYEFYRAQLIKEHGASAALELDKEMAAQGISVDYGN